MINQTIDVTSAIRMTAAPQASRTGLSGSQRQELPVTATTRSSADHATALIDDVALDPPR